MPIVKCAICGKECYKKPREIKRNKYNYCSRICASEGHKLFCSGINHPSFGKKKGPNLKLRKRVMIQCTYCNKDIETTPFYLKSYTQHFCNHNCKAKWQEENLKGVNNPFYGKSHPPELLEKLKVNWFKKGMKAHNKKELLEATCFVCHKTFGIHRKRIKKNKGRFYCSRTCWSNQKIIKYCNTCGKEIIKRKSELAEIADFCSRECRNIFVKITPWNTGERNPMWLGGTSKEPYTLEFNEEFKALVRARDNYCCLICNKHEIELPRRLSIHHIDYNKKNTLIQNGASLCLSCHAKTNINRKHWIKFFQSLLTERYDYEYTIDNKIIINLKEER